MEPQKSERQIPDNRNRSSLYEAILMFAGGKRYLMRAPIRMWWNLQWKERHDNIDNRGTKFKEHLRNLERQGYIRRFPGGIEIMENIHE